MIWCVELQDLALHLAAEKKAWKLSVKLGEIVGSMKGFANNYQHELTANWA